MAQRVANMYTMYTFPYTVKIVQIVQMALAFVISVLVC
jgi:hypothetical protein